MLGISPLSQNPLSTISTGSATIVLAGLGTLKFNALAHTISAGVTILPTLGFFYFNILGHTVVIVGGETAGNFNIYWFGRRKLGGVL